MKRIFVSFLALVVVLLTACKSSNKDIDKFTNRNFKGSKGGSIVISKDKSSFKKTLLYSGASVIKPNTDPSKVDKNSVEKSKVKEFKNVKILQKSDGKYLVADELKYKLKIVDDNTIIDVDDNNEYRSLEKK
ncbi:hypothetical protein HMPREF3188_00566 [Tissierellia bacterium KA00581]|nr:hypothetical protein HMPREF3188_00566 [Tissierellia bacterium KA00581]